MKGNRWTYVDLIGVNLMMETRCNVHLRVLLKNVSISVIDGDMTTRGLMGNVSENQKSVATFQYVSLKTKFISYVTLLKFLQIQLWTFSWRSWRTVPNCSFFNKRSVKSLNFENIFQLQKSIVTNKALQ